MRRRPRAHPWACLKSPRPRPRWNASVLASKARHGSRDLVRPHEACARHDDQIRGGNVAPGLVQTPTSRGFRERIFDDLDRRADTKGLRSEALEALAEIG